MTAPPPDWMPQPPSHPQLPPGYPPPPPGYGPYGGYPPGGYYPYARPNNGLAIASLVCGCLPFLIITPFLAVIFGHIARRQVQQRGENGGGMALAGLILGYIFSVIVILAGIGGALEDDGDSCDSSCTITSPAVVQAYETR